MLAPGGITTRDRPRVRSGAPSTALDWARASRVTTGCASSWATASTVPAVANAIAQPAVRIDRLPRIRVTAPLLALGRVEPVGERGAHRVEAAVDVEDLPADRAGAVGEQEQRRVGDRGGVVGVPPQRGLHLP